MTGYTESSKDNREILWQSCFRTKVRTKSQISKQENCRYGESGAWLGYLAKFYTATKGKSVRGESAWECQIITSPLPTDDRNAVEILYPS